MVKRHFFFRIKTRRIRDRLEKLMYKNVARVINYVLDILKRLLLLFFISSNLV